MNKLVSPGKYHGGKGPLASKIVALMPPRCKNPNKPHSKDTGWSHYVEPYFGMGAVLLANDPNGISECVNDLNGDLVNLWRVLQDTNDFVDFQRAVEATPFSEALYNAPDARPSGLRPHVHCAWKFFVQCRQSLAGRMKGFTGITKQRTRRGMNAEVSAWLNCIEGLPEVHARLKRVLILNRPALNVIKKHDGPRTLLYLDPPYAHSTRATIGEYMHEMVDEDHVELLSELCLLKGRFLLSGYRCDLYDTAAKCQGWNRHDFAVANHAAGGKKKRAMVESVWCNY